jgi:hypothetical protein
VAINENKGNPVPHGGLGLGAFNLGTDAITPCVLSQNEDLKQTEDPVEGREGLPFEFRDIRMLIRSSLAYHK